MALLRYLAPRVVSLLLSRVVPLRQVRVPLGLRRVRALVMAAVTRRTSMGLS